MATNDSIPNTIEIPLTKGCTAIVDACDSDLAQLKWCVNSYGYAIHMINRKTSFMHRVILSRILARDLVEGECVDHIDGNGLNNRRTNLRLATHGQNMHNQRISRANTSGYKGVTWNKREKRWRAGIKINGVRKHLGTFNTPEEAYNAYCAAAILFHGEFARLR